MLNDANRRKLDVIMVWAIDRLGRSLIDLLGRIQHLVVAHYTRTRPNSRLRGGNVTEKALGWRRRSQQPARPGQ